MLRFLNECAQIEETTALIYYEFANSKKCHDTLADIWLIMARDEEDHAQQLKRASRLISTNTLSRSIGKSVNTDEIIDFATDVLSKAKNGSYGELEMLKVAVVMENAFRNIHATSVLEFKDPSLLATFRYLACADAVHLKGLDEYIQRYKNDHLNMQQ